MKRPLLASALSICFSLVAITSWLLLTPTPALAATGTANCSGGQTVSCSADACWCFDGYGCDACNKQSNGTYKCTTTRCKSDDELY